MADILVPPSPNVKLNDKIIQQLLNKLDQGAETIMNLRSLLTYKTVELNELVHQLELIDQVLINVENGTEQIELVLKDVLNAGKDKLLDAEATLDSALKSACSLCSDSSHYKTRMTIVNKINSLLDQLNIDSTIFWNHSSSSEGENIEVLQKILFDLNLAKTIASNIKNDTKHRSTIIKNKNIDQINKLSDKIKSQLELYKLYTRNSPFLFNGKQGVLEILERQDNLILKKQQHHHILPKQQNKNNNIATVTITNKKKRQSTPTANITMTTVHNNNNSKSLPTATNTTLKRNNINKTNTLLLLSRHTSSSKAKSKEPKRQQQQQQQQQQPESEQQRGPGSTLRLRNMLAKRNPALKMLKEQRQIMSSTTVY